MDETTREKLLDAYKDLRVADVRDGMDTFLYHPIGSMSPDIRPLYRTRACGIARTCRYLPARGVVPNLNPKEYWDWVKEYYDDINPYPWILEIKKGDFIVIDQSRVDVGLMGSESGLWCKVLGANGLVTDGGVRDVDEIVLQEIPFWSGKISQSMVQGRLEFDAMNVPIEVGGVQVRPGDMIVADGDGVIAVPQDIALDVAREAHAERKRDMKLRRELYDEMGWKHDDTVAEENE